MEQGVLAGVSGRRTRPVRSGRYPELCSAGVSRCSPHSSSPGCSEGRGPELVESGSCQTAQRIVPSPLHSVRARVGSRHTSLRSHRRTRGTKRRKKYVELSVFARRIGTRFGAMAQFIDHNRTERDVGDFRRAPAGDQLGLFLPEQRNARWCPEGRSFERKPLFKFTLRPAAETRHRTGDAVEEPDWPTVLVDGTGRHWSHGHNDVDVGIDNIHVDA
jgi:hypothetical protein